MKEIIVIFKTHLDIGFTNLSKNIVEQYNTKYIPLALKVGEEIQKQGREEGFIWTTGSWLIHQYLKNAKPEEYERMCRAIKRGIISWHGLPFTMHSEIASKDIYEFSLSLAKELDEQFKIKTIGAKNTDVPGHTIGIVPLLKKAGIELLHIGVNGASAPPETPDIFKWKAPTGEEIIVMYSKGDYGDFTELPNSETAIYFAHTNDNTGPQSVEDILKIYDRLHEKYPEAKVRAGNLNDVAKAVMEIKESLPTVTSEIGDSWIHGGGTDPKKVSQYRAMLRLGEKLNAEEKALMYEKLFFIPEHTWGLDEKTFLKDHDNYTKGSFEKQLNKENYKIMEQSWEEQREYVNEAVKQLSLKKLMIAKEEIKQYKIDFPNLENYSKIEGKKIKLKGYDIAFNEKGAVCELSKEGQEYANESSVLGEFKYEIFSEKEVLEYRGRYDRLNADWSIEDFGKVGLGKQVSEYKNYTPKCEGVYYNEDEVIAVIALEKEAIEEYTAPEKLILKVIPQEERVDFDFAWFNKTASRVPEALSLKFSPVKPLTGIEKIGTKINPLDVVSKGNREMHATSGKIEFEDIELTTVDAVLVCVEKPSIYGFYNKIPRMDKGIYINLFNNQWGTNFPMWYREDARFRFTITTTNTTY